MRYWADGSNPDRIADPAQALCDAREAHEWATRELANTTEPVRVWNLGEERKRLAGIFSRLKRRCVRRGAVA